MAVHEHFHDRWPISGYAIISADGMIADHDGRFPDSLRHDADWDNFQAELDRSAATVLGRLSHEAAPNTRDRLRIVATSRSPGLVRGSDAYWWNPGSLPIDQLMNDVLPNGGRVAVAGGRAVFDMFLQWGYSEFHLTRRSTVLLPGGVHLFSPVTKDVSPESVLSQSGLTLTTRRPLDSQTELLVWTARTSSPRRPQQL